MKEYLGTFCFRNFRTTNEAWLLNKIALELSLIFLCNINYPKRLAIVGLEKVVWLHGRDVLLI